MKRATVFGIAALALIVTSAATAGHRGHGQHSFDDGGEHRLDRMREVLDLSDTQSEQMQAIFEGARERRQAERDQLRAQREQLKTVLDSDAPDATEVGRLVIAQHQHRQQLRAEREGIHAEIEALLTPEQLEKLEVVEELRSERREHRLGRRHGRTGHHGPPGMPGPDPDAQGDE